MATHSKSTQSADVDRLVLRRGGAAGLAGSAAMLGAFIVVGGLGLPDTSDPVSLTTFPEIATSRLFENSLYLAALVLWAVQFVAIGRALRDPVNGRLPLSPSAGVFGLAPMAAGALLHLSTSALSDRYVDPAATAADKANIVLVWTGVQAVFDTLLVTGAVIVPLAVVALSWTLLRSELIGRLSGPVILVLALIGSIGGMVAVADPGSIAVAASVLSMLGFNTVIGWRLARS